MADIKVPIDTLLKQAPEPVDDTANGLEDNLEELEGHADAEVAIQVDITEDVTPIEIKEIIDVHGRLSDILDSLAEEVGLSVIPLRMANIAPEVSKLQRHEIFTFAGERYAFSKVIRQNVCDRYIEQIVKNISEGVPYQLELITTITWKGNEYKTLLLSRAEWTYIMSKCRDFKQKLITDQKSQITLQILAERA